MDMCWIIDVDILDQKHHYVIPYLRGLGYNVICQSVTKDMPKLSDGVIYPYLGSFEGLRSLKKTNAKILTYGLDFQILRSYYMSYMDNSMFVNDKSIMTTWGMFVQNYEWYYELYNSSDIFIRPDSGKKTFTGQVINKNDIKTEIEFLSRYSSVMNEHHIWISPKADIGREYRFWISNQKVVASSEYSWNKDCIISKEIPADLFKFAEKIADLDFQVDYVYTVDLTHIAGIPKIIELNSFSCAGVYDCDVRILLETISHDILIGGI